MKTVLKRPRDIIYFVNEAETNTHIIETRGLC